MMFVAYRDRLPRVVYVIIRYGLPPPGLGVRPRQLSLFPLPRHLFLSKEIERICITLKRSQKLPGADSSSEANRFIGDLISYSIGIVEEPNDSTEPLHSDGETRADACSTFRFFLRVGSQFFEAFLLISPVKMEAYRL
jgi:hypothetical protein